jgi:hypothetical protein
MPWDNSGVELGMSGKLTIGCPCCGTKLVVDQATGVILSEERPKADHGATFDQAMKEVRSGASRREDAFNQAFERTKNLDDLLQKKFDEAKRKAAEDPTKKPRNPLDFD